MRSISIRELLKSYYTFDGVDGVVRVSFDDGDLLLTTDEAFIGTIILKPLLVYPDVKIKKKFFLTQHYNEGVFSLGSIKAVLDTMLEYLVTEYFQKNVTHEIMLKYYKAVMEMEQELYRQAGFNGIKYWDSIDFEDALEVQESKEVLELINAVAENQTPKVIKESYTKLKDFLEHNEAFKLNPILIAYKARILDDRQIDQSFVSRGFTTEMNDFIFPHPVVSSYFLGLRDLYSWLIESRSAAKSLRLSLTVIQNSEYSSRKQQLAAMVVRRMVHGDCGSTSYQTWVIQDETELKKFRGKYYLDEETNTLKMLEGNEVNLINKKIKVRSAHHCQLEDKTAICQKCLGDSFLLFPTFLNLGYITVTTNSKDVSQRSLSAKHLTLTAETRTVTLNPVAEKYFEKKRDGITIKRSANVKQIIIPYQQAQGLIDVFREKRIDKISLLRIAHISKVYVVVDTPEGDVVEEVTIKFENRHAYITDVFLRHILNNNLIISNKNDFIVDMKGFKSVRSIFDYKNVEFSMEDQVKANKIILENVSTNGMHPDKFNVELFSVFNKKLDVNIVFTEVFTYALSAKDMVNGNADLSRGSHDPRVMPIPIAIKSRSAGAFLGFDNVVSSVNNPVAYKNKDKPSVPLEVLFRPNEVVKGIRKLDERREEWMKTL